MPPTPPLAASENQDGDEYPPTAILPEAPARHWRHARRAVTSERQLRTLVVAGSAAAVVLLSVLLVGALSGGEQATGPTTAQTEATEVVDVAEPDEVTEPQFTAEPPPSPSPTAAEPPRPAPRPADLIAGIQAGLSQLVQDGHIKRRSARELDKRLDEASRALASGEIEKAWAKLRETTEKIGEFQQKGELSPAGYQALTSALTQLAQVLPPP